MNAVVSSTVWPSHGVVHGGPRSALSVEERVRQTAETIASIRALGAERVIVADNSERLPDGIEQRLGAVELVRIPATLFENKGIAEAWLLASLVDRLRLDGPVLKVSGRYTVGTLPTVDWQAFDLAGVLQGKLLVTRCYAVRELAILGTLMRSALREIYAYQARVVGPRSLLRIVRNSVRPAQDDYPHHDPRTSLEQGAYHAIRHEGLRFCDVGSFGMRGVIGGGAAAGTAVAE